MQARVWSTDRHSAVSASYPDDVAVEPGARAEVKLTVGDEDTAVALSSGDVPVLATPRVVALCEEASVAAVDGHLPAGQTTVGMRIQLDHLQPNAVGST